MDKSPYIFNDLPIISVGYIKDWVGSIDNLPEGWALCDGTNGTPDMRDRFATTDNPQDDWWLFIMKK